MPPLKHKNKKRVLFVSHSAELYGAEKFLLDFIVNINKDKFEVYFVSPKKGELSERISGLGIPVFFIGYKYWLTRKSFSLRHFFYFPYHVLSLAKLVALMTQQKIDLVYTNTCVIISGAIAAKMCGKPHVWHIHESVGRVPFGFRFFNFNKAIFGIINYFSKVIVVNSAAIKDMVPSRYFNRVRIVYNGFTVDDHFQDPLPRKEIRGRYNLGESQTLITVIGSISARKGQIDVIAALPQIIKERKNIKLFIVGEAVKGQEKYMEWLKCEIKKHGLCEHVFFTGYIADPREIYSITDILVVPSREEPFGRVVAEGMLHAIPVIGTDTGGIPEMIKSGETGLLVKPGSPGLIAQNVLYLLSHPDSARRYGIAAKAHARRNFTLEKMVSDLEDGILSSLCEEG